MAHSTFSHAVIKGISYVIPSNIEKKVEDQLSHFDNNIKKMERAKKFFGYGCTYISPIGLTAVDLCEYAGLDLIDNMNVDRDSIDALIFVSQCPDYHHPASSSVLHGKLNLSKNTATFDINQGCTGYVYGLLTAFSLIESRAFKKILLLAGDLEYGSDEGNKSNSLLFSSAGSATLIEYSEEIHNSYFVTGSDGKGYEAIITPAGGYRIPINKDILDTKIIDKDGQKWCLNSYFMDGLSVSYFTQQSVPSHTSELMTLSKKNVEDIDFFAIHQANKQIVDMVARSLKVPNDKYSSNTFTKYGNTNGVSCLSSLIDNFIVGNNFKDIALVSFGIGLSLASAIIDVSTIKYSSGIVLNKFEHIKSQEDLTKYWKNKIENYSGSII